MYIFCSSYLLHSYNPSIPKEDVFVHCFHLSAFYHGLSSFASKKAWATPRSVSFGGLIQNFRRASVPPSYAESPPPPPPARELHACVQTSPVFFVFLFPRAKKEIGEVCTQAMAVARLGFKRRATAVLKSNLIRST